MLWRKIKQNRGLGSIGIEICSFKWCGPRLTIEKAAFEQRPKEGDRASCVTHWRKEHSR